MSNQTTMLPVDVLVAVLFKVGPSARIVDDARLAKLFDEAAQAHPLFRPFARHPQYHYSERLSSALHQLDLGGSIERRNAAAHYFTITPHTAGAYGRRKFESLEEDEKQIVSELATRIQREFGE